MRRDKGRCRVERWDTGAECGQPASDVDHIVPGQDHSFDNLQAICRYHHDQKTAREAAHGQREARAKRYPVLRRTRGLPGAVLADNEPPRLSSPSQCVWPDCLSEADRDALCDDIGKALRGEVTEPRGDARDVCGCDEAP